MLSNCNVQNVRIVTMVVGDHFAQGQSLVSFLLAVREVAGIGFAQMKLADVLCES